MRHRFQDDVNEALEEIDEELFLGELTEDGYYTFKAYFDRWVVQLAHWRTVLDEAQKYLSDCKPAP